MMTHVSTQVDLGADGYVISAVTFAKDVKGDLIVTLSGPCDRGGAAAIPADQVIRLIAQLGQAFLPPEGAEVGAAPEQA